MSGTSASRPGWYAGQGSKGYFNDSIQDEEKDQKSSRGVLRNKARRPLMTFICPSKVSLMMFFFETALIVMVIVPLSHCKAEVDNDQFLCP